MMKSRRILMVKNSDSYTVLAPSDSTMGDKALSSDTLNQSSLFSSFPNFFLFHKNTSKSSAADNIYGNPYALSGSLNPSVTIIIVVLLCGFFFIVFFSIYVRICASEEDTGENSRRGGGENRRMNGASQGLDKSIIETFPVFNFSFVKGLKQGKQILECAVCLSEFEDDETLRLLPKCGHAFHPDCIDMWLFSHTTCPLCRSSLVRESNIVEQSMRVVEGQPRQGTLHAAEQVVDVSAENAVQNRVDHQGGHANEIMNLFDPGLFTTRRDQTRVLQQS